MNALLTFRHKRILIIGGAPGTGKTELAHWVARHWGYHIETFGPNDDVSKIFNATQNKSLTGYNKNEENKKDTCLIIDGLVPGERESDNIFRILESYWSQGKFSQSEKFETDQVDKSRSNSVVIDRQYKSKKTSWNSKTNYMSNIRCLW